MYKYARRNAVSHVCDLFSNDSHTYNAYLQGYIMRLRGYISTRRKLPGYEKGLLPTSFYYTPKDDLETMLKYAPLQGALASREFPTSWRDIDIGAGDFG